MASYRLSPRAQKEIADIWSDTVEHWGVPRAERYVRQIAASIELVAENPAIARACDEIRPGYRKFPSGSHMLFIRVRRDGIEVVRILHGRMDFQRNL